MLLVASHFMNLLTVLESMQIKLLKYLHKLDTILFLLFYVQVFLCFFFSLFFLFVGGRKEQTSLSYSINYFKENTAGVDLPQVCGCVCV